MTRVPVLSLILLFAGSPALALPPRCEPGHVWEDGNGNGRMDSGERPLRGVRISDGIELATTDGQGRYTLPVVDGRIIFVIKPASHDLPVRRDGLPDFWSHVELADGPSARSSGKPVGVPQCRDFGLLPKAAPPAGPLEVLVFADPQVKSHVDIDYYARDIVEPLVAEHGAQLGITLGDVVDDDLALYPEMIRTTTALGVPWMHVPGNHDLDFDAPTDEDSLRTYRQHFGPDTFAREEAQAVFIALDNVVYRPGAKPAYIGGLREDQFGFLQAYLSTVPEDRLLVLAMHIPLFNEPAAAETFRSADRQRLFDLLRDFPHVLVLSGHAHTQRHWYHDGASGWGGETPLHEFSVGAASGAFWSGVKDEAGIPAATMADGTPNGYARLRVGEGGAYSLTWHVARDPGDRGMGLHLPKVLRRGAYPAWGVYANMYMGDSGTRVEYRIDGGQWRPMKKVMQPDPALLVENVRDDLATGLRGYDRSPEAKPSQHLWRGALPTDLALGEHRVEVRVTDRWRGTLKAEAVYRLEDAYP